MVRVVDLLVVVVVVLCDGMSVVIATSPQVPIWY